jgi:general secretion pathway protein I
MRKGFTLLEVLVATLIMGIAVAGLMNGLATSTRTAAKLTEYDRATLLAKSKMDELLADHAIPRGTPIADRFDPVVSGGVEAGWNATITPFETAGVSGPGKWVVDRVELEIWWMSGNPPIRRGFTLEGFRRSLQ